MEILRLIRKWNRLAYNKFMTAKDCDDPIGRKMLEHGAFCHMNSASELRHALRELVIIMTLVFAAGVCAGLIWKY